MNEDQNTVSGDGRAEIAAVLAALDWLQSVHDSDPSARRLQIVREGVTMLSEITRRVSLLVDEWEHFVLAPCSHGPDFARNLRAALDPGPRP